jgi:hypothetical protein
MYRLENTQNIKHVLVELACNEQRTRRREQQQKQTYATDSDRFMSCCGFPHLFTDICTGGKFKSLRGKMNRNKTMLITTIRAGCTNVS